jgi:hypothetical protein
MADANPEPYADSQYSPTIQRAPQPARALTSRALSCMLCADSSGVAEYFARHPRSAHELNAEPGLLRDLAQVPTLSLQSRWSCQSREWGALSGPVIGGALEQCTASPTLDMHFPQENESLCFIVGMQTNVRPPCVEPDEPFTLLGSEAPCPVQHRRPQGIAGEVTRYRHAMDVQRRAADAPDPVV